MSGVTKLTVVELAELSCSLAGLPKERNAEILWEERAGRRLFTAPHMLSSDMAPQNMVRMRGA